MTFSASKPEWDALIAQHKPGYTLDQAFYVTDEAFALDCARVLRPSWHLVGHVARIAEPGQYFTARLMGESLILVRDRDGNVNGFYNVCRHRGSLVCLKDEGKANRLVCPYHAWSYGLDGTLKSAPDMPEGFNAADFGLKPCRVQVSHGLIFVALDDSAGDFDDGYQEYAGFLDPYDLANTRIARRTVYPTPANWKLVYENFTECYHCVPSHPEYITIHSKQKLRAFGAGEGSGSEEDVAKYQPEMDAWQARAERLGMRIDAIADRDTTGRYWRQAGRFPIRDGFDTESRDGKLMAPLLGHQKESDGGQTAISFNPMYTVIVNADHAILFRFTPIATMETEVELTWLVHKDAREGVDYDPDTLTWAWDVTNRQDGEIVTNNQLGILSDVYEPGPYSLMETRAAEFVEWYLNKLAP